MDRTGFARGRVNPVIYFESSSGYCILAPQQIGEDTSLARRIHQERFRDWEWREAGTWQEVTALQTRLQNQELEKARERRDVSMAAYDAARKKTTEELRMRMQSAGCDSFEREFIRCYLELAPEKRAKYEQRFMERQHYLWAVEQNSTTKVEDRMPSQPGEFWRA